MSAVETLQHKSLQEALLGVQGELKTLPKDATNPHFKSKFTPLDTIVEHVGPLLIKHGLTWSTFPCFGPNQEPALRYKLTHVASGEVETEIMPLLLTKSDPQGFGSATTYGRRYSITAVLNLVADEDDDGNSASRGSANGGARVTAAPVRQTERIATAKQRGLINGKAGEKGLPPVDLAGIIIAASEGEVRDFESQAAAEDWLRRAMDRLPARLVTPILEAIERADPEEIPA